VTNQVRTAPPGDLAGNSLAIQGTSFGDAASGAALWMTPLQRTQRHKSQVTILTADPPLSRTQGGKNSSMRPRDTGVHAQQEPRRRPSTHQFNAISPVIANTCLPPSSSRLMIHRHSSVVSRPRNARSMLCTVSSPIAQCDATKTPPRRRAPTRRERDTKKVHNHASLPCRRAHCAAARLLRGTALVRSN